MVRDSVIKKYAEERQRKKLLIAAAPEMLEMIKTLMPLAWREHRADDELALLNQAEALINRLTDPNP